MSDESKDADSLRVLIEQNGLQRAAKLYPDAVKAAAERGLRPVGAPPKGTPALIQPAGIFDPSRFEPRQ